MLSSVNKLDLIGERHGTWRLILIVEAGEWQFDDSMFLIQEKLNAYAIYALDGQMHRMYPDSVGKPVSIVIRPVEPPPPDIAKFIDQIAAILAKDGLTVTVEPLPAAEAA
jgi:hypothetical protein